MKRFFHVHVDIYTGKKVYFTEETPSNLVAVYHEQSEAAPIWTLQHDQNSNQCIVQVSVPNGNVLPHIKINDLNTIAIDFGTPTVGSVTIIFFG